MTLLAVCHAGDAAGSILGSVAMLIESSKPRRMGKAGVARNAAPARVGTADAADATCRVGWLAVALFAARRVSKI